MFNPTCAHLLIQTKQNCYFLVPCAAFCPLIILLLPPSTRKNRTEPTLTGYESAQGPERRTGQNANAADEKSELASELLLITTHKLQSKRIIKQNIRRNKRKGTNKE